MNNMDKGLPERGPVILPGSPEAIRTGRLKQTQKRASLNGTSNPHKPQKTLCERYLQQKQTRSQLHSTPIHLNNGRQHRFRGIISRGIHFLAGPGRGASIHSPRHKRSKRWQTARHLHPCKQRVRWQFGSGQGPASPGGVFRKPWTSANSYGFARALFAITSMAPPFFYSIQGAPTCGERTGSG